METYTLLARHIIQVGDGIGILRHLAFFGTLYEVDRSQPSWVPNWSRERRVDRGGDFPTTVELSHLPVIADAGRLAVGVKVRGLGLGRVSCVYEPWPAESTIADSLAYISKVCLDDRGRWYRGRTGDLYRLLCAGVRKSGSTKFPLPGFFATEDLTAEDKTLLCVTDILSGVPLL